MDLLIDGDGLGSIFCGAQGIDVAFLRRPEFQLLAVQDPERPEIQYIQALFYTPWVA